MPASDRKRETSIQAVDFTAWLALLVVFLLFTGCERALDRAELVVINGSEPELLDPAVITAQATGRVAYALLEGLTVFDAGARAQPGVAERWELSEDGRVYTFHLRENSIWSNGDPVSSSDFLYSESSLVLVC